MLEMWKIKKLLLEEEKALEEFLREHGGLTLGWTAKDHQAFLQLFLTSIESEFTGNSFSNGSNDKRNNENIDIGCNNNMTHVSCRSNDQNNWYSDINIKWNNNCKKSEESLNVNISKIIKFIAHGLKHLHLPLEEIATHVERYVQYIKLSERVAELSNYLNRFNNKITNQFKSNAKNTTSKRAKKTLHDSVNCSKDNNNIEFTSSISLLESAALLSEQKVNNVPKTHSLLNKELKMHLASIASNYTQAPRPVLYITQTKMEREEWARIHEDAKRKHNMLQERTLIKESNCKHAITEALWHEWHAHNEDDNKHVNNLNVSTVADNARISTTSTTSNANAITNTLLADDICSDNNNKNVKTHRHATFDAPTASSAHRIFLSEKERHERLYSKLLTDVEYSQSNVNQNSHELHSYSYT